MSCNNFSSLSQVTTSLEYEIIELKDLEQLDENRYVSLSNDPSIYFSIKNSASVAKNSPAHVYFHCLILSKSHHVKTEIFFPLSDGSYSQKKAVSRYSEKNKSQAFLISSDYLDKPIRFDPIDVQEEFEIRFMKFYLWSEEASLGFLCLDFKKIATNHRFLKQNNSASLPVYSRANSFKSAYDHYLRQSDKSDPYSLWISIFEKSHFSRITINQVNAEIIKFSILIPVFNTDPSHLRACVESVLEQEYGNWELCIVDDCSSCEDTIAELKLIESLDSRIKVKYRSENGHIVKATNDALQMSTGDKVCFLDHDDLLSSKALLYFAIKLEQNKDLKLIYTDEDFVNELGVRANPHFKSDWNRTLLYSHNYITHFVCCDAALAKMVGGLRLGTDGAQDYDFLLRVTDTLEDDEIYHIPYILYHWRMSDTSTASNSGAKPYTVKAGLNSLINNFNKKLYPPQIACRPSNNFYSLRWPSAHVNPLVSIVIPTRDNVDYLQTCIESLEKTSYQNYEIIILDNGSRDISTLKYMRSLNKSNPRVKLVDYDVPFNFARINNYAVEFCSGSILCFLNDDTEVISHSWLEIMLGHSLRENIGCVGAKLLYGDNSIQHAGIITSIGGLAGHSHKHLPNRDNGYFMRPHLDQEVSAVTGACLMIKKEIFERLNGFDEFLFPVAFNDVDFCLKVLSSGLKNIYAADAVLYHHESKTRGYEDSPEKQQRFLKEARSFQNTWKYFTSNDNYYSPHLTRKSEDFSIRN